MSSVQNYLLPLFGTINVLAVAIAALFVVPQYIGMFKGFGMELPNITRLMLATYRWWALLAFVIPVVWFSWPTPRTRGVTCLIVGTAMAVLLGSFVFWGCYAPVVMLARTVG